MKKIICLLAITFYLSLSAPFVLAEESPTPPTDQKIIERVQERIEGVKEKVLKRAFWGTLKEITNSTLVLDSTKGELRIKTDSETKFLLGKKEIKMSDLAIGNFIIAMGYLDENGNLTAKRIISLEKAPQPTIKRYAVYGQVSDISQEEKVLSLTHPKREGVTFEVKVTNATVITKKVDGKIKKVTFSDIEIGDRAVAVGTRENGGGTLTAKIIHVIPGKAAGLEKQVSPTPTTTTTKTSPTPTPKPKTSPTTTPAE